MGEEACFIMGFKVNSKLSYVFSFTFISDLRNEVNQIKAKVNCEVEIMA